MKISRLLLACFALSLFAIDTVYLEERNFVACYIGDSFGAKVNTAKEEIKIFSVADTHDIIDKKHFSPLVDLSSYMKRFPYHFSHLIPSKAFAIFSEELPKIRLFFDVNRARGALLLFFNSVFIDGCEMLCPSGNKDIRLVNENVHGRFAVFSIGDINTIAEFDNFLEDLRELDALGSIDETRKAFAQFSKPDIEKGVKLMLYLPVVGSIRK